jgi:hypothetical protein
MNEVNNTPIIEAEVTPTAPKAETKKQPIILAPKSMRGKKGTAGAPARLIIGLTKNPCRGRFTLNDLVQLNGNTISSLTIRNRIHGTETCKGLLETGELTMLPEKHKAKGKPGKPADVFILTKYIKAPKATVETAPVVDTAPPAPEMEPTAPAPEPVHIEQVAEQVL